MSGITPHKGQPCICVGMTIPCQCKCHISKSRKTTAKELEELKQRNTVVHRNNPARVPKTRISMF